MADQSTNPANPAAPSDRTKVIPIQDGLSSNSESSTAPSTSDDASFTLGSVTPAHTASQSIAAQKTTPVGTSPNAPVFPEHKISYNTPAQTAAATVPKSSTIPYKIWSLLEFVAVTGAIFMIFFFIFNWQSYSQLFQTKLDIIKGAVNSNPYLVQQAENIKNASPEGQKPLPIVQNAEATKKQIPALSLEIAPPDDRIIIPRISQNVPIIRVPEDKLLQRDWTALEGQIQDALRHGVVHFPGTALPGQDGNIVITGHSSYFPWDPGRFKDVFALLHQVDIGDQIVVYHDQVKYTYQVYDKKVVKPSEVDVLTQKGENRLTLITCTPVGTALNRLVILAHPVADGSVIASNN